MKMVYIDASPLETADCPLDAIARLGEFTCHDRSAPHEVIPRLKGAQIVIDNKVPFDAPRLAQLPELKLIAVTATGYNMIDTTAARERGITVCNVPEYSTDSVAQFTFALLLELVNRVGLHDASVKAGDWVRCPDFAYWKSPQIEIAGMTMGILGYGKIGKRVGQIAEAFGMEVLPIRRGDDLSKVLPLVDVLSLHCPQTPQTAGIINRQTLSHFKPNGILINTSRGGLVVEQDLADALNAGKIASAAVDVVSAEPMKPDNPLLTAKNCIITPHIAWATLAARKRAVQKTAENIAAFLAGKPINVVN